MSGMPRAEAISLHVSRERASTLQNLKTSFSRAFRWVKEQQITGNGTKRLRVSETVSLGEKRFVAVVEVDGLHFLVGGGPSNVSMLAHLNPVVKSGAVLTEAIDTAGNINACRSEG
jgi:flagellar biogenesis protein FliO